MKRKEEHLQKISLLENLKRAGIRVSGFHQIPRICCIPKLVSVIPTQQHKPRRSGLPPDLISCGTLLFKPMAAIAMMIKNLDSSFNGVNTLASIPTWIQSVVTMDAAIK